MLTHALRMPNAKEVFFLGFLSFPPTRPQRLKGKKHFFLFMSILGVLRGRGLRPRPRSSCFIPLKKNILQSKTMFLTLFSREG
jgi:hypothetical protein